MNTFEFMLSEGATIAFLNGMCTLFICVGTFVIVLLTGIFVYLMTILPFFQDQGSRWYVADPQLTAIFSAFTAIPVALSFMVVFDQAADTLLYVFDWNSSKDPETVANHCPPALAALVQTHQAPKAQDESPRRR